MKDENHHHVLEYPSCTNPVVDQTRRVLVQIGKPKLGLMLLSTSRGSANGVDETHDPSSIQPGGPSFTLTTATT